MKHEADRLVVVETSAQWRAYHDLRRRILWEARGQNGVYLENHPDEHKPGNHPMLLQSNDRFIGVVRVDIDVPSGQAIMRRVAVAESEQRQGHGRTLVRLVEDFAVRQGCRRVVVASAEDAMAFYEKCGYRVVSPASKQMSKEVTEKDCEQRAAPYCSL